MFRDIIALIDANSRACADSAASLASAFGAHLTLAAAVVDRTYSAGFSDPRLVAWRLRGGRRRRSDRATRDRRGPLEAVAEELAASCGYRSLR